MTIRKLLPFASLLILSYGLSMVIPPLIFHEFHQSIGSLHGSVFSKAVVIGLSICLLGFALLAVSFYRRYTSSPVLMAGLLTALLIYSLAS